MNFKEILKKYWFICLVAVGLLVFFVAYAVQSYQNRPVYVEAKNDAEGRSIVYTLNGEDLLADDLYDRLYNQMGANTAYNMWSRAVINAGVETTEEISTYASNYANYLAYYNDRAAIDSSLRQYGYSNGYDDLLQYCTDLVKGDKLYGDFYGRNFETYVRPVIEAYHPKKVYHILITVADVQDTTDEEGNTVKIANMTAEEEEKLNAVIEALKTEDYAEVCAKYSDEESTKDNGGYLGIYDDQSIAQQMVTEFANAVIALDYGEVSEPVLSQYGYHIIKVEEVSDEELKNDDVFMSEVSNYYSYSNVIALKEKSDELGFVIKDEKLLEVIEQYIELAADEIAKDETVPEESGVNE